MLCCRGRTPTHKLTGVVAAAASNAVKTMGRPDTLFAVPPAVDDPLGVAVGVVGVGVGVVGVGVGVVGVGVGAGVVGVGVVGVGVGAAVVEVPTVGAAVVVVADAVGVAVAEAFVADALADAVASVKGSQDSLLPVAVAAAALPLRAATTPPEAAVSSALPAIKVTARRRPCAIRILTHSGCCSCEIKQLVRSGTICVFNQVWYRTPTVGRKTRHWVSIR